MFDGLDGRTAVVTGAGAGIGRAIARRLSASGATVVGLDINEEPHDDGPAFDEVVDRGELVVGDVSDPDDVDRAFEAARGYGDVSVAVNNAGIGSRGGIEEVGLEMWREMFAVHVEGAYHVCRRALPPMADRGDGRLVNIASVGALVPYADAADYAAAKGSLVSMTRQLAADYSPAGVRVNCVAPGIVRTKMSEDAWYDEEGEEKERLEGIGVERTLLPYVGTTRDVADAVAFLCSDRSRFITGQVLPVDGGWSV
jgi:NAD(P)-dependent dehydrogenase (short-subunit alcohol dehydrogenase family)